MSLSELKYELMSVVDKLVVFMIISFVYKCPQMTETHIKYYHSTSHGCNLTVKLMKAEAVKEEVTSSAVTVKLK